MSIFHLVQTTVTGRSLGRKEEDQNWLQFRLNLLKNFTIKSLQNQIEKNFIHWITFRPEDIKSLLIKQFVSDIKKLNYRFIISYCGQPSFNPHSPNKTLRERISPVWPILKKEFKNEDYVYLTTLDSDDMLHKDAIREIQSYAFGSDRALYFKKGYLLNTLTMQLGRYSGLICPPFFTLLYSSKSFWDVNSYLNSKKPLKHHSIPGLFSDAIQLTNGRYIMGVHGTNTSTRWNDPAQEDEITDEIEKKHIFKNFGIYD